MSRDRIDLNARLTIERLGARGEGIARTGRGLVFVPFALAGEKVLAEVDGERGRLVEVLEPAPDRIAPFCPLYGECGGCAVQILRASAYLAWFAVKATRWSYRLHDVSQGQDATPIWIVQIPMALGAVLLAICFADNLITLLATRRDNIGSDMVDQSQGE